MHKMGVSHFLLNTLRLMKSYGIMKRVQAFHSSTICEYQYIVGYSLGTPLFPLCIKL